MTTTMAPAPPRRPDTASSRKMPSTAGYWIGAIVAVVGLALAATLGVMTFVRMNDHLNTFPRMSIPGTMTVNLDASTGRTIYVEWIAPLPLAALDLRVTDPNGKEVVVRPYVIDLHYDVPGFTGNMGHAVGTFNTTVAGPYQIEAAGTAPSGTTLAVGDTFYTSILGYGLGAFAALLLALGGGLTLVIVTAVRRSRARRAS